MMTEQPSSFVNWLRRGAVLGVLLGLVLAGPLGNLHVVCAHHGASPAAFHDCDLCAKFFGNPTAMAFAPEPPASGWADEALPEPSIPSPAYAPVAPHGRAPPGSVFCV